MLARCRTRQRQVQANALLSGTCLAVLLVDPRAALDLGGMVLGVWIAVVTLAQLPVGPSVGAAAAVLILGSDGVAVAAAAGVLLTVTGTVGGLCFAAWAGADKLWSLSRGATLRRGRVRAPRSR